MEPTHIDFKVAMLSVNTNSFGLRGHVLIAQNGLAYKAGTNSLNTKEEGTVVSVPLDQTNYGENLNWAQLGFEIPERLPDAPPAVVNEVWA